MVRVARSQDCGNSPKNLFIQELAIALSEADLNDVLAGVSDEIEWITAGGGAIMGKASLRAALASRRWAPPRVVVVDHVVTHGRAGAVNGTLELPGGRRTEFCHVFEFTNAKGDCVGTIKSYFVDVG